MHRNYITGAKTEQTSFIPCHTIIGKGIAYVKPFDLTLPLRPVETKFENNRCCLEVCNTSDCTIEFQYSQEIAYFDARSKGLVQINNSKHFPIDQYLHDKVAPATLSPKPIAYDKPIDPSEMPRISTCTEMTTEDTNVPTQDDKYPWLDPNDKQQQMTDAGSHLNLPRYSELHNCFSGIILFSLDILTRSNTLKLFPFLLFLTSSFSVQPLNNYMIIKYLTMIICNYLPL